MSLNFHKVQELERILASLGPEVNEIVESISAEPGTKGSFFIEIPDASSVDLHIEDLASLVARTSNAYGRAARFAGHAKAQCKLAEGRYKHRFKISRKGRNETEREQAGMEAAQEEYLVLTVWEAIVEYATSMENGARIASESARKIYVSGENQNIAYNRELKGKPKESDWTDNF